MAVLVVDEADEVFANLYSTGISLQNALPRLPGRPLVLMLGVAATSLAALVGDLARHESFLFLHGALFVPLFGVLARRRTTLPPCIAPTAPSAGCAGRRYWRGCSASWSTTGSTRARWRAGCRCCGACSRTCSVYRSRCRRACPGWARRSLPWPSLVATLIVGRRRTNRARTGGHDPEAAR